MTTDIINQPTNLLDPQTERSNIDYILVDGSGSMAMRWNDSMTAVDSYVNGLASSGVSTTVTMATFSQSQGLEYVNARESKPDAWYSVAEGVRCPGGATPLYDAINMMMRVLHEKMPGKCSILIVTDGEDTSSKTTVEQAKHLLDWARRRGWQVTFLGCDFENSRQAKMLGANAENALGIKARQLTDATSALAQKRSHYERWGAPMGFSEEEKKQFGGYLPPAK